MITSRRSLITGLVALVAAPAIVRVASLMPVKAYKRPMYLTLTETTRRFAESNQFLCDLDKQFEQFEQDRLFFTGKQWPVGVIKIKLSTAFDLPQHSAA